MTRHRPRGSGAAADRGCVGCVLYSAEDGSGGSPRREREHCWRVLRGHVRPAAGPCPHLYVRAGTRHFPMATTVAPKRVLFLGHAGESGEGVLPAPAADDLATLRRVALASHFDMSTRSSAEAAGMDVMLSIRAV